MKKIISILSAAVLSANLLAGCGGNSAQTAAQAESSDTQGQAVSKTESRRRSTAIRKADPIIMISGLNSLTVALTILPEGDC